MIVKYLFVDNTYGGVKTSKLVPQKPFAKSKVWNQAFKEHQNTQTLAIPVSIASLIFTVSQGTLSQVLELFLKPVSQLFTNRSLLM